MYLSPRNAASRRASGVRRVAGRLVVPAAPRLGCRVEVVGSSWTTDGAGITPGTGEVSDSIEDVVFMLATLRTLPRGGLVALSRHRRARRRRHPPHSYTKRNSGIARG